LLPPLPQNPVATILFGQLAVPPQFVCETHTEPWFRGTTLLSGAHPPPIKPFADPDNPAHLILAGLPPQSGFDPDPQIAITALLSGQVTLFPQLDWDTSTGETFTLNMTPFVFFT
tara:strand:- start:579 stop:923 length:345 start_codon:yes stop_codon:yes gene_type:complete